MSNSEALRQRFEAALMPNYGTPPLAIESMCGVFTSFDWPWQPMSA